MSRRNDIAVLADACEEGKIEVALAIARQISERYPPILDLLSEDSPPPGGSPWRRGTWSGKWISIDGCDAIGFESDPTVVGGMPIRFSPREALSD